LGGERVQWWGARHRTAVYVPFSVYTMAWSGEHRAFVVDFIKNGGSPVATQCAFRIRFTPGRRDTVPDKKTIYRWVSNFRQTGSALKQDISWPTSDRNRTRKCGSCQGFDPEIPTAFCTETRSCTTVV